MRRFLAVARRRRRSGSARAHRAAGPPQSADGAIFVVAANPLAAEAGMNVLRRGGSAVDAAVAVQAMLSLVEPQSSGLGGGAFMTITTPRPAADRLRRPRGRAGAAPPPTCSSTTAASRCRSAPPCSAAAPPACPASVAMLASRIASTAGCPGTPVRRRRADRARRFIVCPRLARCVNGRFPQNTAPDVRAYFSKPTERSSRPATACATRPMPISSPPRCQGPDALYRGRPRRGSSSAPAPGRSPGTMTLDDLAGYRPVKRESLCRP